jgi:hypothetical protein
MVQFLTMLVATTGIGALGSTRLDCVPTWATTIKGAKTRATALKLGRFSVPNCRYSSSTEIVSCDPETMRAHVESVLLARGLLPFGGHLSAAVYGIARNIASEAGSGSPAEKVAIGEAALNRMQSSGWPLRRVLMRDSAHYGRQRGRNPPVSTRQDPRYDDLVAAELVVSGATKGFARGATHYFSPSIIDALHGQDRHPDTRFSLLKRWSQSWGMSWVGPLPGVNRNDQFFLREGARAEDEEAWKLAYIAAQNALKVRGVPPEASLPVCGEQKIAAASSLPVLGGAVLFAAGYVVWKWGIT